MRGEKNHSPTIQEVANVMSILRPVLYLMQLSATAKVTCHYPTGVVIYFIAPLPKYVSCYLDPSKCHNQRNCTSIRPSHPPSPPYLSVYPSCSFRSAIPTMDQASPSPNNRTPKILGPIVNGRTTQLAAAKNIAPNRAGLDTLVESWTWPCGPLLVVDLKWVGASLG